MFRQLIIALAVALTLGTGYVHGVISGRWGVSGELAEACQRLQKVPVTIGDWTGEDIEIPARELEIGEIDAYVSRQYRHPDGRTVHVTLVCGRPGPISVHTPDVCFRGAGFQPIESPKETDVTAKQQPHRLMLCDFVKQSSAAADSRRVFWGWSSDGQWQAPENPRLAFAGNSFLYKLYVHRGLSRPYEADEDDPGLDFLNLLIPELQQALFERM